MNTVLTADTALGPEPGNVPGLGRILEWVLKDRDSLRRAVLDESIQARLLTRLLGVAVLTLAGFGLAMAGVLRLVDAPLAFMTPEKALRPGLLALPLGYPLGMIGALGVCMPSFWFYALQLGFEPSLRRIAIHTVLGQALTGVFLVGILPVYAAFLLGLERIGVRVDALRFYSQVGLLLPLAAGLFGVNEIFQGFVQYTKDLPQDQRGRREGFTALLAFWSAGLYVCVAPVLVYRLLEGLAPLATSTGF